ncbi:MAG: SA1320 family protein [Sarcina sp.]
MSSTIKESTSYVSYISYEIENMFAQGKDLGKIKAYIAELKEKKNEEGVQFPENLNLVDAYFDPETSVSASALVDTNTGEVIIGVAGTNPDNKYILGDLVADIKIGTTGLHKDSLEVKGLNEFIQELQENYNVTTITGHSLGGGYAEHGGMHNQIPFVVVYNAAPTSSYGYKLIGEILAKIHKSKGEYSQESLVKILTKILGGIFIDPKLDENKALIEQYEGTEIRFTSDSDWLSPLGEMMNGIRLGDNVFNFKNGKDHAILGFLAQAEQKRIEDIKTAVKFNGVELDFFVDSELKVSLDENGEIQYSFINNGKIEIDIDGDGKIDLSLNYDELKTDNLWYEGGANTDGKLIKLETEDFLILGNNLNNKILGEDIAWIKNAVNLCKSENEAKGEQKEARLEGIGSEIITALNSVHLGKLLYEIEITHGELMETENRNILLNLSEINMSGVYNKLTAYDTEWSVGGVPFDANDLRQWIKDVQATSEDLHEEITGTTEFLGMSTTCWMRRVFRVESISDIVNAFEDITNKFLERTRDVFKGIGLRYGKEDGIVDAISEVLDVEEKNINELGLKVSNLGVIAKEIGTNFKAADDYLAKSIENNTKGSFSSNNITSDYNAYLEENNILDDVKDVLEAYDLQVEEAASELASKVVSDYQDVISMTNMKMDKIMSKLDAFKSAVDTLDRNLDLVIESKSWEGTGQYDMYKELSIKNHGTLASFLGGGIGVNVRQAKSKIFPIIDDIPITLYTLQAYSVSITDLKSEFTSIIEDAIYSYNDLSGIIQSQNLISVKINTIISEIKNANARIGSQFEGKTIESFQVKLTEVITLFSYFNLMVIDCFGENSSSY